MKNQAMNQGQNGSTPVGVPIQPYKPEPRPIIEPRIIKIETIETYSDGSVHHIVRTFNPNSR